MKNKIINEIISKEIIKVDPNKIITFASGIKSIVYCDNRKILGEVELRNLIVKLFCDEIKKIDKVDVIAGTATAGIPWAAFIANSLNMKMSYVRLKAKDHGTKTLVEGCDVKDKDVILIEDLITTGSSVIQAAKNVIDAGARSVRVISIFSYDFKVAITNFKENKIDFTPLIHFLDLVEIYKQSDIKKYKALISWWKSVE